MKNFLLTISIFLTLFSVKTQAQEIELDLLRAPSSPASNLLGIATTEIDKPSDLSSFMVSIQSATTSLTAFPSNYAIDFSPYYLLKKRNTDFTLNGLQDTAFKNIFKQTLVISIAISNPDTTSTHLNNKNTYGSLGFKFSIFRGKYDSFTKEKMNKLQELQYLLNNANIEKIKNFLNENDKEYVALDKEKQKFFTRTKGLDGEELKQELIKIINSEEYKTINNQIIEKTEEIQKRNTKKILEQSDETYKQLIEKKKTLSKDSSDYKEIESKIKAKEDNFQITKVILEQNDNEYKKLISEKKLLDKKSLEYQQIEAKLKAKEENFQTLENENKLYEEMKSIASQFQTQRVGFSWDVNGGISGEFRNRNFNNSKLFNAGIWTNLGYTIEKGFAFLGLVRYLYNPDKILALDNNVNEFENVSTLDAGARIAYSKSQSKFSCSIEGIYRSVLSGNQINPSWKMIFNADYAIMKNQKLTFSFGRDFDGTITKDGNLIAALTLIAGFGNKR